jgi:V/A-type H+-transporting ATPase subunit E
LDLKAELSHGFAREVERLVSAELKDKEVLKQLILAVASRAREEADQAQQLEILLPRHAFGLEELRHNPDELAEGELTKLVHAVVEDRLRDGVRFAVATDDAAGIRVRLVDHDIILDLSDQTVAHLLLEHLQPRFRALLEGVVK